MKVGGKGRLWTHLPDGNHLVGQAPVRDGLYQFMYSSDALDVAANQADNTNPASLALFILLPVWVEFFGFGSARLLLNSRGVIYQTRRIKSRLAWADVQRIVLTPSLYGQVSKRSFLVFYADAEALPARNRSEFHPRAFGAQYRKDLPDVIAKYCDLPIENLDLVERH